MTVAISVGSVCAAIVLIVLFLVSMRRVLRREIQVVTQILDRYDERLASFAQTLHDALQAPRSAELESVVEGPEALDAHRTLLRTLELATDRVAADGAMAILSAPSGPPTLASIRLSHEETSHVARIGVPDYHGARAIQVSFGSETTAPAGSRPIRSGLYLPLLGEAAPPSMIAVLTRSADRRFSDADIEGLQTIIVDARPALERAVSLRALDPVPELDPLTELYDRQSFGEILDREIARARADRYPLTLLVIDVDRLTTVNALVGRLAADEVLADVARLLREATGREGLPSRVGGGRYAVLLPRGEPLEAEQLFARLRGALATRANGDEGPISASAGVAALTPADDAGSFVARANAALSLAKQAGPGTMANGSVS
jgi:diguanylate cyclase (GGDEF)-like protein